MFENLKKAILVVLGTVAVLLVFLLAVLLAMLAVESKGEYRYQGEMELAHEYPAPNEAEAAQNIVTSLETILARIHPWPERTLRDAHVKQHGLVKAEFTVLDGLAEKYRVGLFSEPRSYPAWIRYSSNFDKPDYVKNARGMAIKLMEVDGPKLLPAERDARTHDFVMMSAPYFPNRDAIGFGELLSALESGKVGMFRYLLTHPRVAARFLMLESVTPDLFSLNWSSATPYLYGDGMAVKYAIRPVEASTAVMPTGEVSDNYLRERMTNRLAGGDVHFDFFIQQQLDPKSMPIEDARVVWSEKRSPLIKVATIRILKQTFDTDAQQLYGDQMSFTPWHALPQHRPLGGVNRGRKIVYEGISKFRHTHNGEDRTEPTSWDDFTVANSEER